MQVQEQLQEDLVALLLLHGPGKQDLLATQVRPVLPELLVLEQPLVVLAERHLLPGLVKMALMEQ